MLGVVAAANAPATDAMTTARRAVATSGRAMLARAAGCTAPVMMSMSGVGFEGGTIAFPTHRACIDPTQREAHARRPPSR
jgi:hypothetical protein